MKKESKWSFITNTLTILVVAVTLGLLGRILMPADAMASYPGNPGGAFQSTAFVIHNLYSSTAASGTPSTAISSNAVVRSFQATIGGASAISATVDVQASNDGTNYADVYSFDLAPSPAASATQVYSASLPYKYVRAYLSAISGVASGVTMQNMAVSAVEFE